MQADTLSQAYGRWQYVKEYYNHGITGDILNLKYP
jgi:hypothetical protein